MSQFWIDIEDSSSNKIGAGPLAKAGSVDIVRRLDQAGTFQVRNAPASDVRSGYVIEKRTARVYSEINRVVAELGGGIMDEIAVHPADLRLDFRGSDLLRELTYRQVGSLAIDDGAGGADVTGPQDIIALAPAGWTLDTDRGFETTEKSILHMFEGETVLQALVRLAEITGEHFYLGTGRTLVWMRGTGSAKLKYTAYFGTFAAGDTVTGATSGATGYCAEKGNDGASDWLYLSGVSGRFLDSETITGSPSSAQGVTTVAYNPSSGLRAVQGGDTVALEGNEDICVITNLERVNDSYDLITRVYPYGAGDGDARTTLDGATWTPPSGYSISTGTNYIKRDAGETSYGQIERYLQFKDIVNPDTLAEAAYNWLRVMSYPLHVYRLEVAGLVGTINPGQTMRVIYHRWIDGYHAIDIDEDLIVLETTTRIDERGARTVALEVSTLDRWALDDAAALVSGLAGAAAAYTHPQPISGSTGGTAHTHLEADITDLPVLIEKLATVTGVDLNSSAADQALYVAPASGYTVITHIVIRNPSATPTTASFGFGWNSPANNVMLTSTYGTGLNTTTRFVVVAPALAGSSRGTASATFACRVTTPQGSACTVTIDVFGYRLTAW